MTFEELAIGLQALEAVDVSDFQRRARVLQALWRVEQGFDCGEHRHKGAARPLGSRLPMPWAQERLANFLSENIRSVVRSEVLDPRRSQGKLFGKPRIFNDLLSSQPLCFNLFGELCFDLPLASRLVRELTRGRFHEVVAVAFEHSPSRSDSKYSADRSAFDVFLECKTASGGRGFVGVEVKYHENLLGKAADHRGRYDEIAKMMDCFGPDPDDLRKRSPLQQIWRDHLLCGIVRATDGYDDALFVILYPAANDHCSRAIQSYNALLTNTDSFASWTLEEVLGRLMATDSRGWAQQVFERYCDFAKIERALAVNATAEQSVGGAPDPRVRSGSDR
jgi:hypothetical protein